MLEHARVSITHIWGVYVPGFYLILPTFRIIAQDYWCDSDLARVWVVRLCRDKQGRPHDTRDWSAFEDSAGLKVGGPHYVCTAPRGSHGAKAPPEPQDPSSGSSGKLPACGLPYSWT